MVGLINETDSNNIEQEFIKHNLSFRKSFNDFNSEINSLLFYVNDNDLYNNISAQYVTLRIYEAVQNGYMYQ